MIDIWDLCNIPALILLFLLLWYGFFTEQLLTGIIAAAFVFVTLQVFLTRRERTLLSNTPFLVIAFILVLYGFLTGQLLTGSIAAALVFLPFHITKKEQQDFNSFIHQLNEELFELGRADESNTERTQRREKNA